jgi:CubicO group peptidase (beta-lactamase class C family)
VERFLPFRRASSGLNTTAEDLARWIIALQSGLLISRPALETAWTPVPFNHGRTGQWGLGWQVLRRSTHRAVGMTGGGRAAFYIYPENDVAVVILTNLAGAFPEDMVDVVAARFAPSLTLTGVPALRATLEERGYGEAEAVAAALARADPDVRWEEAELNDWGYRLLSTGRPAEALQVLRLAARFHPESGNAQDSLGEALLANGDRQGAIAAYERATLLDPANSNARTALERLRSHPN